MTAPHRAEVREVDGPVAAAGQLLVDVERVGICGADVELYTREMAYIDQGFTHFPIRLGHEWTGHVVAAGSDDDAGWVGKCTRDIALKDITAVGILSASPGLAGAIAGFVRGRGRA